jgi:hypothetical protein
MRRVLALAMLLCVLVAVGGCAADSGVRRDDDPRNDPNQYWDKPPGFTPFSA